MATETDVPDALSAITLDPPADPDAQATVNDFLDYTEYFPSDLIRSLTLIGKLDRDYKEATAKVHDLTALYGSLPTLPANDRPEPQILRAKISAALEQAISYREAAYAEASRLADVASRHSSRLTSIKKKLQALPQPPSRDPTPPPASPQVTRSRKPELERAPRLTLHVEGGRRTPGPKPPKHRRILIPGEVLPPPGPEDEVYTESEEESAVDTSDELGLDAPEPTSRVGKLGRVKIPKTPRPPKALKPLKIRAPGQMGTNVHSQVAGISTSNALALLTPPPPEAKPGSKWMPWFKLTEWEMAKLRKQMKKNAIWTPSDTMIRRVLAQTNRGREHYEKAKRDAEEKGEPFLDEDPVDPSKTVLAPGEVSMNPAPGQSEDLINRGMRLNEAKKQKKEQMARERAEALELEEANRKIAGIGSSFKNLFNSGVNATPIADSITLALPANVPKKDSKLAKKRKRDSDKDIVEAPAPTPTPKEVLAQPGPKKLKINHPIAPKPTPNKKNVPSPIKTTTVTTTTTVPLAPAGPSASPKKRQPSPVPAPASPVEIKKTTAPTPIVAQPTAAQSRSRRTSVGPRATIELPEPPPSKPKEKQKENEPPKEQREMRPRSRGSVISGKAASAEPPSKRGEGRELREKRRASVVDAHPASDPASAAAMQPRTTRAGRRPVPGLVTTDEDGKGKVSVGKRKAAPKKKVTLTISGDDKGRKDDTLVDEGFDEPVDPNEPRYCICGDVSYGTMIACENDQCEKEWFHLSCIGLDEIPPRRTKWYCPECRVKLGVDEKGNITVTDGGPSRRR